MLIVVANEWVVINNIAIIVLFKWQTRHFALIVICNTFHFCSLKRSKDEQIPVF